MMITVPRAGLLALAVAMAAGGAARAEDVPTVISPLRVESDRNGVNLVDGRTAMELPVLSVPGAPNLRFDRIQNAAPYLKGTVQTPSGADVDERRYTIHTGTGASDSFQCENYIVCTSVTGTGSTFRYAGRRYQEAGSGAVWQFNLLHSATQSSQSPYQTMMYYASSVAYPNGEVITYGYDPVTPPEDWLGRTWYRPNRLTSSLGYFISITYQSDTFYTNGWGEPKVVTLYASAAPTTVLRQFTYSGNTITELGDGTNPSRAYTCAGCSNALGIDIEVAEGSMQLPDGLPTRQVAPVANLPQSAARPVGSVTRDGVQWSYSYDHPHFQDSLAGNLYLYDHVTVTDPNGYPTVYDVAQRPIFMSTIQQNVITRVTDAIGRQTSYEFDMNYRVTRIVAPELNRVDVSYDEYGNITQRITTPKPNMGSPITETAHYPGATCAPDNTSTALCWRPTWSRDGMQRQTDYAYNALGQLIEQTDPADANGVRRKTYITYESSTGISRRSVVRVCGDTTTCGTSSEIRTEYDYWGNTYLPSVERRIDVAQGVTLTTLYSYDPAGRLLSADGPLAGSDDTTYNRYDVFGRRTWEIGPRGVETGLRIATRSTYRDSDDKPVSTEIGTLPDANSTTLSVFRRTDLAYDSRRNPIRESLSASGTTYGVTDKSFDDRGNLLCTAIRMNPAAFGAAPGACAAGAPGSDGPDRITSNVYDAAGQRLQLRESVGTADERTEATWAYGGNGEVTTVIDGNGNRADLHYDGYGRQDRWTFPSATRPTAYNDATQATALATAGSVNANDYEGYGYDPNGNRTSLRTRAGDTLTYQYDNLNRMTVKVVPERAGLTAAQTRDVYYAYDIASHQIRARFDSINGDGVTNTWDGFGRLRSATTASGGLSWLLQYRYDAAGNRTRITHPDNIYFDTSYDAGRPYYLYANGGAAIVVHHYYATGALYAIGHATSTIYGYDAIQRPDWLIHYFNGGAGTVLYTYGHNSAGQLTQVTRDNDAFAWTGHYAANRAYTANGLNQYTAAGSAGFSYDANGNLISDGSRTYVYDVENRLVSSSNGAALSYDPLGRLSQVTAGSTTTRFLYDGDALVAEYDANGNVLRRHVHNPGADLPLVTYEGAGLTTLRHLYADHQGSIVALGDTAGVTVAVNSYDEYGIPGAANAGRFQYTGQAWLPELGMYYYKARIYSPTLGRFMQTDSIGYDGGINLYGYVGDDPVNGSDPTGMARVCVQATGSLNPACVGVDGNGDGNFRDNDLSRPQTQAVQRAYGGFIAEHNGANLSHSGVTIDGQSGEATMLRVATQFVGAIIPWRNTNIFIDNDLGSDRAANTTWERHRGGPSDGTYTTVVNMSWKSHRTNPSELARTLFHERGHHRDMGGMVTLNSDPRHQGIDLWARRTLMSRGLGGMGCSPVGGYFGWFQDYPGC